MPQSRWQCPECDALLKTARPPAGKSIRCPECRAVVRMPADDPDDEDFDRDDVDEADEDEPARKQPRRDRSGRRRTKARDNSLGLWLGIGGGAVAAVAVVVVVLVIVLSRKNGGGVEDKPGSPAPAAREVSDVRGLYCIRMPPPGRIALDS